MFKLPPLWLLLKYVTTVLHFVKIRLANEVEQISFEIRLTACAMQRTLRIFWYFSAIIWRALRIFAPESVTSAENFAGPIFSIISSIILAKNSPVWLSLDRSFKHHKYSSWSDVWIKKFQIDSFAEFDHPSHAYKFLKIKKIN